MCNVKKMTIYGMNYLTSSLSSSSSSSSSSPSLSTSSFSPSTSIFSTNSTFETCRNIRRAIFIFVFLFIYLQKTIANGPPPRLSPRLSAAEQRQRVLTALLGQPHLRLWCPVEADPQLITTWTKDGEDIHPGWERYRVKGGGGNLVVSEVEKEDEGEYVCKAVNGFGTIQYKIVVHVLQDANSTIPPSTLRPPPPSPPQPRRGPDSLYPTPRPTSPDLTKLAPQFVQPFLKNETVAIGKEVVLQCHMISYDQPQVQWLKRIDSVHDQARSAQRNASVITVHDQLYILLAQRSAVMTNVKNSSYLSKLTIIPINEHDSGLYFCAAININGYDLLSAYVTVHSTSGRTIPDETPPTSSTSSSPSSLVPIIATILAITIAVVIAITLAFFLTRGRHGKAAGKTSSHSSSSSSSCSRGGAGGRVLPSAEQGAVFKHILAGGDTMSDRGSATGGAGEYEQCQVGLLAGVNAPSRRNNPPYSYSHPPEFLGGVDDCAVHGGGKPPSYRKDNVANGVLSGKLRYDVIGGRYPERGVGYVVGEGQHGGGGNGRSHRHWTNQ